VGTDEIINEVLATYPVEVIATDLFPKVIQQIEQRYIRGEASLFAKHYAITTLRSHLFTMVNATTTVETGPRVLLGCAPEDQDEIGVLLLALILRRRGFRVIYLGPNLTMTGFHQVIELTHPQLVCFTAATPKAALALADLSQQCHINLDIQANNGQERMSESIFVFSGGAFVQNPTLIPKVAGLYLGDTVEEAVSKIESLLSKEKH
jgi:methanogenic corrinoid protein MtbC1